MGSFESWDKLVRGALIWVGESDPLAGRERIRQDSDPERDALRRLLVTWQEVYGDGARTLAEVRRELQDCESLVPRNGELTPDDPPQVRLRDALCVLDWKSDGKNWNARVVGNVIRRSKGRILDGLKFTSFGSKYAKWKVEGNGIRGINGISTTPYQETVTSNSNDSSISRGKTDAFDAPDATEKAGTLEKPANGVLELMATKSSEVPLDVASWPTELQRRFEAESMDAVMEAELGDDDDDRSLEEIENEVARRIWESAAAGVN